MEKTFYLVDVFAEEKYAGNQLAVIVEAKGLSGALMQKIANETHFSETAFVLSSKERKGGFNVRIFTPKAEVPFAGHPTLGTAYIIRHFLVKRKNADVTLNLKIGQIPIRFEKSADGGEVLWMTQKAPVFGTTFDAAQFAELLGLDLSDFDERFLIQEVSTGLPFIIVPLKSLAAVKRARVNQEAQARLAKESRDGILVFCAETYSEKNDLNVRVFVDSYGIPEDPATGSGNGCLAGYLSKYRYFGDTKVNVSVEQGCEIARPSTLYLKAQPKDGEIQVQVGGKVVLVAKGHIL